MAAVKKAFNFAAAVKQALADFPALEDRAIFIDLRSPRAVFNDKKNVMRQRHGFGPYRALSKAISLVSSTQGSAAYYLHNLDVILFGTNPEFKNLLSSVDPAVVDSFVFDHELGHLVVPAGRDADKEIGERAADVYAIVRNIQRYGNDTGFPQKLCTLRMMAEVSGDKTHPTAGVIRAVMSDITKKDFKKMTPRQTVKYAEKKCR